MRVLIVGCGYAGLPLGVELARQGHVVYGLRRGSPGALAAAGVQPLTGDITRPETLKNLPRDFDWVVNCAASGGGGAEDYRQLYYEGNRNLLDWLRSSPPRKYVFTSSTSVYGQADGSMVNEESPIIPEAPTARVLVEAEQLLATAAGEGFPAVILRVAGIYGPGRGYAFRQFLSGEARIEGDGSRYLNMIHRDDVIGCIVAALTRGVPGEIYNAADSEPVSQAEFYGWLAGRLQRPVPPRVAANSELARKRGITNKRVSNEKLRTRLEYEFRHPNFRSGYAELIAEAEAP